jgi:hypothetical protein
MSNRPFDLEILTNNAECGTKRRDARLKPETRLGLRLLRRIRRIRVHFARNGLARFRCFSGVEFFIGSATAKGNNSAGEENKAPVFHCGINNRSPLDFQRR